MDKDKIDKKDHILDVAEKVFSDVGYDGASTRMISGEAGVNMAMLNYYFGSKEGLFLAVFQRKTGIFQAVLQNIGNDDTISAWDKLQLFIDTYINKVVVNSCFARLINREISMGKRSELTDKISDMLMIHVRELKKVITEGIETGVFKADADVELAISTIFGTKNYISNSPHLASKLFGNDVNDAKFLEEELKPRIKKYLKDILKAYLLKS